MKNFESRAEFTEELEKMSDVSELFCFISIFCNIFKNLKNNEYLDQERGISNVVIPFLHLPAFAVMHYFKNSWAVNKHKPVHLIILTFHLSN